MKIFVVLMGFLLLHCSAFASENVNGVVNVTPKSFDPESWLSTKEPYPYDNVPIREMVIPMSHDSGSFSIKSLEPVDKSAVTQNLNFVSQLNKGYRAFDFRLIYQNNEMKFTHASIYGEPENLGLKNIKNWLNRHPDQIIFIYVQQIKGGDKANLLGIQNIIDTLGKSEIFERGFLQSNKDGSAFTLNDIKYFHQNTGGHEQVFLITTRGVANTIPSLSHYLFIAGRSDDENSDFYEYQPHDTDDNGILFQTMQQKIHGTNGYHVPYQKDFGSYIRFENTPTVSDTAQIISCPLCMAGTPSDMLHWGMETNKYLPSFLRRSLQAYLQGKVNINFISVDAAGTLYIADNNATIDFSFLAYLMDIAKSKILLGQSSDSVMKSFLKDWPHTFLVVSKPESPIFKEGDVDRSGQVRFTVKANDGSVILQNRVSINHAYAVSSALYFGKGYSISFQGSAPDKSWEDLRDKNGNISFTIDDLFNNNAVTTIHSHAWLHIFSHRWFAESTKNEPWVYSDSYAHHIPDDKQWLAGES